MDGNLCTPQAIHSLMMMPRHWSPTTTSKDSTATHAKRPCNPLGSGISRHHELYGLPSGHMISGSPVELYQCLVITLLMRPAGTAEARQAFKHCLPDVLTTFKEAVELTRPVMEKLEADVAANLVINDLVKPDDLTICLDLIGERTMSSILCCAVLCCAVLCCAVLCCAVLCCAVLCCAVLCCAVLCCAVLCCAVLCCAVLCCAVLCATLCCVVLCCVVLCCVVLCCVVLCCAASPLEHHTGIETC